MSRLKVGHVRLVSNRRHVQAAVATAATRAVTKVAVHLQGEARRRAPHDDGVLRSSIAFDVRGDVAVVGTNVHYAVYQHEGTGKYHPQGRKTPWVYYSRKLGRYVLTEGNPPTKFLESAALDNRAKYQGWIRDALRESVEGGS